MKNAVSQSERARLSSAICLSFVVALAACAKTSVVDPKKTATAKENPITTASPAPAPFAEIDLDLEPDVQPDLEIGANPQPEPIPAPITGVGEAPIAGEKSSAEQLASAIFENEAQKSLFARFTTGKEFCKKFNSVTDTEAGFRIEVPVDYENPALGKTEIWGYFAKGLFDPKRPSMIYVDGGPGGNSHGAPAFTKSFNEIRFDQRGIGCSRPSSLELYRNPNYYGSLNTARDMEEIRKHLGINQLSILGISYGTVPATIYANLFPERTTAVVLEGVMFDGKTIEESRAIPFGLRKMYKSLPEPTRLAMKSYFTKEKAYGLGLYQIARMLMYSNRGLDQMQSALTMLFPSPEGILRQQADQIFDVNLFNNAFFDNDRIDAVDMASNKLIQCQEFPSFVKTVPVFYTDETGKFHEFEEEEISKVMGAIEDTCALLKATANKYYSADRYPILAPVTYYQGNWDGATMAPGAVKHFKKTPKTKAQLFIAKKGGHTPNLALILKGSALQLQVFEKSLRGEQATQDEVKGLNEGQTEVQWTYTSK